jgi:hypothetical protein
MGRDDLGTGLCFRRLPRSWIVGLAWRMAKSAEASRKNTVKDTLEDLLAFSPMPQGG